MPEGWDFELDDLHDCEMTLFDAVEYLNKPADSSFTSGKLAQMRVVMARANESQNDIQLAIATYAEHLTKYPPDVVASVLDEIITTQKWFPVLCEVIKKCEDMVNFRRKLMRLFESKRNPLMIAK